MKVEETALPGVLKLTARVFGDDRGSFREIFNQRVMTEAGLPSTWAQDNFSVSRKNVVRGLHYQLIQPQGKLVWVALGAILDVAVDLRRSSPHFGEHVAVELTADGGEMLWIPVGFGHGFAVLSETARVSYKVTDFYNAAGDRTLLWNDPEIGINWPVSPEAAIISEKDYKGATFRKAEVFA